MEQHSLSLSVLGSGSYGTALAIAASSKGVEVCLYCRDPIKAQALQESRENAQYLPNIKFPEKLKVSPNIEECIKFSKDILIVVPSSGFVPCLQQIKPFLTMHHRIVWATKGLETNTGAFFSEVVQRELAPLQLPLAAISGPTFARELATGMPTAIACAGLKGSEDEFVSHFCQLMHTPSFRVYKSNDLLALQLGGAVKNVIAIGAGMSDGLGFGANARTALISRGLAEMIRLGLALGASERGFMGLSGLGDLILTCTDNQSRNRRLGYMLGQGTSAPEALKLIGQVVEGYHMVKEVIPLAKRHNVDMPICNEIYEVLVNHKPGKEAAHTLLNRELTAE